jgi:DNA-binding CsgD family transcriptional regulator
VLDREEELRVAEGALDAAAEGDGSAFLISGEAGIGKTTLLRTVAEAASRRGFDVLRGSGDRLESELSFGVCMQLFRRVERADSADGPFAGAASLARVALGEDAAQLAIPGEDRTLPLVNGLYWLCDHLAERNPLLIVVDDAQWADLPTLRFLHYLARRLDGMRVALAVASRPDAAPAAAAQLAALAADDGVRSLRPGTLGAGAARRLIAAELGEPGEEFASACLRLSGGNPLYLMELLRAAGERGLAPTDAAAPQLDELRPERIVESVAERLGAAGEPARALAEAAAASGGRLHLRDAADLAGLPLAEAERCADALVATAILDSAEPPRCAHPLVRAAVLESIPPARRAGLHLRIAELLRATGESPEAVAAHLLDAERRGPGWVVDVLEAAAAGAMSNGSPAAAARYLSRALEERPARERRAQLLVTLGLAETESGSEQGFDHLATGADLLPAPEARAGALLGLGMALTMQAEVGRATEAYQRGIAALAGSEGEVARNLTMLCEVGLVHDREARAEALPRIEALSRSDGVDGSATGRMLLAQAAAEVAYQGGPVAELRALAERALAPGLNGDDPAAFWTHLLVAYAYDDCDDYDSAEAAIAASLELARRRGSSVQASAACHPRAFVNLRRGRVEAALADARASAEGAETGWRIALPSSRALVASAHLERGDLDAAQRAAALPGGDEPWRRLISFAWMLALRGRLLLALGEAGAAWSTLQECAEACEQGRISNPAVIAWRSPAALAAMRLGREAEALELAQEEVERAESYGAPRAVGIARRTLGLVAGGSEGLAELRASADVLADSPARLARAHTLVQLGAAMRREGSRREAREPLGDGLDLARRCGAAALADAALTELRAAGGRPRRFSRTGADSLTPSELRVCSLATEGLSNPQIAQALFVTRRTVETHLTSAYRKLSISSRDELGAALARDDRD